MKRVNENPDYVVEADDDPNKLIHEGSRKKKRANDEESSSRIITSTGEKLDLKKSQQIKSARRKKEEKLTKNRKRELKQVAERKEKKQTVSYLSRELVIVHFMFAEIMYRKITHNILESRTHCWSSTIPIG
jgi:hypothetical protein